jgi:hypothetical protein
MCNQMRCKESAYRTLKWIHPEAGPKADAVGTAVLGRTAAETSAAIAEHTSLIGFVPHLTLVESRATRMTDRTYGAPGWLPRFGLGI